MKNGLSCAFLRDAAGFLKISLYRPFIYYLKSSFARKSQMWWPGRGNSGGSHGRLPSPARTKIPECKDGEQCRLKLHYFLGYI